MKILYVLNVDWFFVSHRLPIALRAIELGYEVHLACGITDKKEYLESLGIIVHPLSLSRSGTGILNELRTIQQIDKVVRLTKPNIIHGITIKGVIYSGLISRFRSIDKKVFSISGLGYIFVNQGFASMLWRFLIVSLYRMVISKKNTRVIFQNPHDKNLFIKHSIVQECSCVFIRGSGVDLELYKSTPEKHGRPLVMFLARLLKDKGLVEFLKAATLVKKSNQNVDFVLVGDIDLDNPNSITLAELEAFKSELDYQHWGYSHSVHKIIPISHIMALPSYREGLPKSLIEAAACGRAVITTDVPGCRDAITPDVTGLLVPPRNIHLLAEAILKLVNDTDLRQRMGKAGRDLAESSFDINNVVDIHMKLYAGEL